MCASCLVLALAIILPAHALNTLKTTKQSTKPNSSTPSPKAIKAALNAYNWALKNGEVKKASVITIIDFTKPSFKRRLWVIDLKNGHTLMRMHVAQGRNTGAIYAKHFSNASGSHESSPGLYTTQTVYDGKHGESLRVNGLEKGINSNALNRSVVIHPAPYVTPSFIKSNGYAGRSWGCFAVNPAKAEKLINLIKGGSVLFAYAPAENNDPLVNHNLSNKGETLYNKITHTYSASHWLI